jgi:hypothetical protein
LTLVLDAGALIAVERGDRASAAETSDVVDASIVIAARRYKATVISSDRADLVRLDPTLPVVDC